MQPQNNYNRLDMNNPQEHEYVDLGLPSGTLWATCNVGASKPEDYGDYFAWGETKKKDVYDWDTYKHAKGAIDKLTKYCDKSDYGYNGFADTLTELQPIDDPATANWGNGWYTPKKEQWYELMAHTDREWTTRNGVKGWLFTSRRNGKSLFLPAAGFRNDSSLYLAGSCGYYWLSSLDTDDPNIAWRFYFSSGDFSMYYGDRIYGQSVRAVRSAQLDMNCCPEHEHVDLGLPSGTLWATCNVGASKPEDHGDYYAWGETQPKDTYNWNTYQYCMGSDTTTMTKYCTNSSYGYNGFVDTLTELQPIDDPATANWGNGWYTPKKEQWDELYEHTNSEWTTRNGVEGWLFTSRRNGKRLFLPAAGYRKDSSLLDAGSYGSYWSSSLYTDNPYSAWILYFGSGYYIMSSSGYRYYGGSVRAVRFAQLDMNCCPEHEYVDLDLPSGTLWATCNVGASKPEDYGDYYAWGETKTKSVYDWNTYKHAKGAIDKLTKYWNESDDGYNGFADTLTELQPIDDPATANWGNGWYTPKKEQWYELMALTNREWTTRNGVKGCLFTSRRNGKSFFLPAAGSRYDGSLRNVGYIGYYWSSSLGADFPGDAWYFYFGSGNYGVGDNFLRYYGFTVRPVRSSRQN